MKYLWWVLGIFAVYYLATDPAGAAHLVHQVVGWLHSAGQSGAKFANGL